MTCLCTGTPPCWVCTPPTPETPAERVQGDQPEESE